MNIIYVRDFSVDVNMQQYFTPEVLLEEYSDLAGILSYLDMKIHFITVARHDDYFDGHWKLALHTDSGMLMHVDLVPLSYRLLFCVEDPMGSKPYHFEKLILKSHPAMRDVFDLMAKLPIHNGGSGDAKEPYGCQDFALAFLSNFGLSDGQCFPYELRRTVTRWRPSLITENDDKVCDTLIIQQRY